MIVYVAVALAGVDDVVRSALERDPELAGARAALDAARGARSAVAVFSGDPEVQLATSALGDLTFAQGLQPVSPLGAGWSDRRAAARSVDAAGLRVDRAALIAAAEARRIWAHAATDRQREAVAREGLALATSLREAVERRNRAGEASNLDVALARSAEADAAARLSEAARDRAVARAALLALAPDATDDGDPLDAVPGPTPSAAPHLRADAAAADVEAAQARRTAARADAFGAFGVGLQYQSDGGEPDLGPMIGWTPPLWTRNRTAISAANAEWRAADVEARYILARAAADAAEAARAADVVQGAWAAVRDATWDDALMGLARAVELGEIGVVDAVVTRRNLLDGRLAWLDARQSYVDAALDHQLATDDPALLPD